jgi:hypothetical protein
VKLAHLVLLAALPLAAHAAPQWPTLEPYLPEKNAALLVIHVDQTARDAITGALPFEPAIVHKVFDEHFGAFAASAGIDVLKVSNVFGGLTLDPSKPGHGVMGFQLPVDLPKVSKMLKASARAEEITETPDAVIFKRGASGWAFLPSGFVLVGKADSIDDIVKRKGAAPSNAEFLTAARSRGADAQHLFLMATLPAGLLPPLPEHPMLANLNVDRQLTTHLTGVTVSSAAAGLNLQAEFDDAASATKLVAFVNDLLTKWKTKAAADLTAAETKAQALGSLGSFHPELISGRMGVEFSDYVSKTLAVKADGKNVSVVVPREMLAQFKGTGTLATLGVMGAIAVPALQKLQPTR